MHPAWISTGDPKETDDTAIAHTRRYTDVSGAKILLVRRHLWVDVQTIWCQRSERPNPVALFMSAKIRVIPEELFNYKNRQILQGMTGHDRACSYMVVEGKLSQQWPNTPHTL